MNGPEEESWTDFSRRREIKYRQNIINDITPQTGGK